MAGSERRFGGHYGFAREPEGNRSGIRTLGRLVHTGENEPVALSANVAGRSPAPKARPTPSSSGPDDERWVIRAKKSRPAANRAPAIKLKAQTIRMPAFVNNSPLTPPTVDESDGRSKRWLAIGLAGMVYAVGLAGLWSIVQTFDQPSPLSITPAGDDGILPPLDDSIDVRDARLDGPFRPESLPEANTSNDVVSSDQQRKI